MKIRKLPLFLPTLFFAAPAFAQNPPPAEPPAADKPAEEHPAAQPEAPPAEQPAAPAPAPVEAAPAEQPAAAAEAPAATPPRAPEASIAQRGPDATSAESEWGFDFRGYIRAPMRVGVGTKDNPGPDQSGTTFHRPIIPDDQYLSWQSSPHNKSDWGEMFFTVGNAWAKATVALQSYNFTEATWGQPETQLGISQGYVTLYSDLGYENVRLRWRVGAFTDKYGQAGVWDAGEYDTYMFGRTHQVGETLRVEFDLSEAWTLYGEHGIGTKRPDPNPYNNARFTMLHHAHAGLESGRDIQFGVHYLHSWTQEENREYPATAGNSILDVGDGRLWVAGADMKFDFGAFGYFYAGYSHIGATRAITVSRAIEVLHASGGGEFGLGVVANYFGPACNAMLMGGPAVCTMGTGTVDSVQAQYEFSLTNFLQMSQEGGQKFWGDGPDLKLALYGMFNKVSSDYNPADTRTASPTDGTHKLKYGADLRWRWLSWLSPAVRFDRLEPNSEIPEQSFSILSPRLTFTSDFLSHEQLTLQYSRYMYAKRTCEPGASARCVQPPPSPVPPDGFGGNSTDNEGDRGAPITGIPARPDLNVFKVEATFWW
jgi:hypothetical protein